MNLNATLSVTSDDFKQLLVELCTRAGYTITQDVELSLEPVTVHVRPMTPEEKYDNGLDPRTPLEQVKVELQDLIRSEFERIRSISPPAPAGTIAEACEVQEDPDQRGAADEPIDDDAPVYPKTELNLPMADLRERNERLAAIRKEAEAAPDPYAGIRNPDGTVQLR